MGETIVFKAGDKVRRVVPTDFDERSFGKVGEVYTVVRLHKNNCMYLEGLPGAAGCQNFELADEEDRGLFVVVSVHEENHYVGAAPRPCMFWNRGDAEDRARELCLERKAVGSFGVAKVENIFGVEVSVTEEAR